MPPDRIVNEIRKVRIKLDGEYPDKDSYYRHLLDVQERCGRKLTRRSPKPLTKAKAS